MGEVVGRVYEETHPWISFGFALASLDRPDWLLLGEAESKCEHIAGAPLRPDDAELLYGIYLTKGVHATTSIEGNTLTEQEVMARLSGDLPLPPSREYLGREIDNVVAAYNKIVKDVIVHGPRPLTPERIIEFNKSMLAGLPVEEGVEPGLIRQHAVAVGRYRAAPAEDCAYLLQRLCDWLNSDFAIDKAADPYGFTVAILKAILAHIYIAWIHPFGDGNGRTARLIEFQLLVEAGLPIPAAHVLSDHYNKTRSEYYRVLDRLSRVPYPVEEFVHYALQGMVDELREQIDHVRQCQINATWRNYVHEVFGDDRTPAQLRRKHLVLDMPPDTDVPINTISMLTPRLAAEYHGKGDRTVPRDINDLVARGLITKIGRTVRLNRRAIQGFMPARAGYVPPFP